MKIQQQIIKKIMAFTVAFAVIVSTAVVGLMVNATPPIDVWDGTVADAYEGGTGTSEDPYLISTPEQLARMLQYDVIDTTTGNIANASVNKYYKLTADIYLNDITNESWRESSPNSWYTLDASHRFCGNIDGDGHTVYGIYQSGDVSYGGLIPVMDFWEQDRTIKNINISDSYIVPNSTSSVMAGGLVGRMYGNGGKTVYFHNCYISDSVVIDSNLSSAYIGGFAGYSTTGDKTPISIVSSASLAAERDGSALSFGAIGTYFDWYGELYLSLSDSFVYAEKWQALTFRGTLERSYNITDLSAISGENARTEMPELDWINTWETGESGYPVLKMAKKDSFAWDGSVSATYAGGTGTEEDPYLISNPAQLARMLKNDVIDTRTGNIANASVNKHYKLTADIYLNDVTDEDWKDKNPNQWYAFESGAYRFCGSLDGDGHTVYGIYQTSDSGYGGLIPVMDAYEQSRYVKNITVSDSYIVPSNTSWVAAGAVAGRIYSGNNNAFNFTNCYVTNSVVVESNATEAYVGGFLGYTTNGASTPIEVKSCAVLATRADGSRLTYGFVGTTLGWYAESYMNITDSFAFCDTFQSLTQKGKYESSYIVSDLADIKGSLATATMPDIDWENTWKTVADGYPVFKTASDSAGGSGSDSGSGSGGEGEVWDGSVASAYAGGTGTAEDPYKICNGAQLARMTQDSSSQGKYYVQTCDIILNDTSAENWKDSAIQWQFTKNIFKGTFDGGLYTISGLYYNGINSKVGLFCYASNATIKNVIIDNASLYSTGYAVGTLIGDANSGNISLIKCYVGENVTVESAYDADGNRGAGGLVGYGGASVTANSCAFLGTVTAPGFAGAVFGNCWTSVSARNTFAAQSIKFCTKRGLDSNSVNNYGTYTGSESGVISVSAESMKGLTAKKNMPELDWDSTWEPTASGYPVFKTGSSAESKFWDGTVAGTYAGGTGTQEDPYIIATPAQLAKMVNEGDNSAGKHYMLLNDIYLNDTTAENWKENAPMQWFTYTSLGKKLFQGSLDGDGFTVYGLYYNGSDMGVGLIPAAKGNVEIKNLQIAESYIESSSYALATLVGYAGAGTHTARKCYIHDSVTVKCNDATGNNSAGGLYGWGAATFIIEDCAVLSERTTVGTAGKVFAGAMVANCWSSSLSIRNSFAIGTFAKHPGSSLSVSGCYSTVADSVNSSVVSASDMIGEAAKTNMPALSWTVWKTTESYPVCRFGDNNGTPGAVWSGAVAAAYDGGTGTSEDPYQIATGEQLAKMAQDTNSAGKYYIQTYDILLNDVSNPDWKDNATSWMVSSNVFRGNFNGDCHTVEGLYYNGTNSKVGLFSYTENAVIRRVIVDNVYMKSSGYGVGTLVGDANKGTLDIIECYVGESSEIESTYDADGNKGAGGLVGYGGARIAVSSSAFLGTVKAPGFAGAILGNCWSTTIIENSFAAQDIRLCSKKTLNDGSGKNYGTYNGTESFVSSVKPSEMKGLEAKENMPNLDWAGTWKAVENGYPVLNVADYNGVPGEIWSGRVADKFAGGSGTEDDPFLISTGEQLAKVLKDLYATVGKYYKLTHDIYLNDVSDENWYENGDNNPWFWVSAARTGNFNGVMDGDGHVVYGLYLDIEQSTDVVYTGLFPTVSDGTVIKNLGVSKAYMKVTYDPTYQQAYVGGLSGYSFFNKSDDYYTEENPVVFPEISQCFGDKDVYLEGSSCGLIAGAPRPANVYDSYFIGELVGERVAAIIGNSWTEYDGAEITRCYSATAAADYLGGGRASVTNSATPINYHDNYANSSSVSGMVTQISLLMMRGDSAKKNMPALDFENVWYALPNGTPVLRIFGTTDKFSNTKDPDPIEVSFVSNGGTECESVYGNPEEPITLPTPTREGYTFAGWYVFRQLDVEFSIDTFPYFNQILYAKWESDGFVQDFENYPNSMYDLGRDYEYFLPGATGYDASYVRNGMAAMHRLGLTENDSDFLVLYEQLLTPGIEYKLSFYITTDTDGTSAEVSLVHELYPDVYDDDAGVESVRKLSSMKDGEWIKVEYTFVANTRWIALRTSGNASLYFDDIMVTPVSDKLHSISIPEKQPIKVLVENTETEVEEEEDDGGKKGTTTKKYKRYKKYKNTGGISSTVLAVIIAASAVAVAAAVTLIIILVKKRRKKQQKA